MAIPPIKWLRSIAIAITTVAALALPWALLVAVPSDRPGDRPDGALVVLAAALEALRGELALAHAATAEARAETEALRQAEAARKSRGRWRRLRDAWRGV